jgi:phenylacetic acid degradation operon negative regulatory protein
MADPASSAAAQLVRRYRRQRPLRGGSLLVTIFGDAIAPRGGAITLGSLIGLAAPFGLNERLVRTSMSRLADDGWLESRREGRLSEYRLSREGRERFAAATRQIYGEPGRQWSGSWTLVLIRHGGRAARDAARVALGWAGFGEPAPGVFAHPALPATEVTRIVNRVPGLKDAIVLATGDSPADSHRQLATLGWDLEELAGRYRRFIAQFRPVLAALDEPHRRTAAEAFIVRTLLIHEYRRIHLRDPLLPAALLPTGWVGADAYELSRAVYARTAALAEVHLSAHAATLGGPLPPADAAWSARFGGLPR